MDYKEVINYPQTAAIISTFRCTASCKECCFACSPFLEQTLSSTDIHKFIDQLSEIPTIKNVVWSGGECFLLGKKLDEGVNYASNRGYTSRCISNGYWAKSIPVADNRLKVLAEKGLAEVNFSTGDDHQEWVPVERVLNGCVAALNNNIAVGVVIESRKDAKFKKEDLMNHQIYKSRIKNHPNFNKFFIQSAAWVSFHANREFDYEKMTTAEGIDDGCDDIYSTIALNPYGHIIGCCGLTSNSISEFDLGKISNENVWKNFSVQYKDFLKIWIFTSGPKKILDQVMEWNHNIYYKNLMHKCLYCAIIFNNVDVVKTIKDNYTSIYESVMQKYYGKLALNGVKVSKNT